MSSKKVPMDPFARKSATSEAGKTKKRNPFDDLQLSSQPSSVSSPSPLTVPKRGQQSQTPPPRTTQVHVEQKAFVSPPAPFPSQGALPTAASSTAVASQKKKPNPFVNLAAIAVRLQTSASSVPAAPQSQLQSYSQTQSQPSFEFYSGPPPVPSRTAEDLNGNDRSNYLSPSPINTGYNRASYNAQSDVTYDNYYDGGSNVDANVISGGGYYNNSTAAAAPAAVAPAAVSYNNSYISSSNSNNNTTGSGFSAVVGSPNAEFRSRLVEQASVPGAGAAISLSKPAPGIQRHLMYRAELPPVAPAAPVINTAPLQKSRPRQTGSGVAGANNPTGGYPGYMDTAAYGTNNNQPMQQQQQQQSFQGQGAVAYGYHPAAAAPPSTATAANNNNDDVYHQQQQGYQQQQLPQPYQQTTSLSPPQPQQQQYQYNQTPQEYQRQQQLQQQQQYGYSNGYATQINNPAGAATGAHHTQQQPQSTATISSRSKSPGSQSQFSNYGNEILSSSPSSSPERPPNPSRGQGRMSGDIGVGVPRRRPSESSPGSATVMGYEITPLEAISLRSIALNQDERRAAAIPDSASSVSVAPPSVGRAPKLGRHAIAAAVADQQQHYDATSSPNSRGGGGRGGGGGGGGLHLDAEYADTYSSSSSYYSQAHAGHGHATSTSNAHANIIGSPVNSRAVSASFAPPPEAAAGAASASEQLQPQQQQYNTTTQTNNTQQKPKQQAATIAKPPPSFQALSSAAVFLAQQQQRHSSSSSNNQSQSKLHNDQHYVGDDDRYYNKFDHGDDGWEQSPPFDRFDDGANNNATASAGAGTGALFTDPFGSSNWGTSTAATATDPFANPFATTTAATPATAKDAAARATSPTNNNINTSNINNNSSPSALQQQQLVFPPSSIDPGPVFGTKPATTATPTAAPASYTNPNNSSQYNNNNNNKYPPAQLHGKVYGVMSPESQTAVPPAMINGRPGGVTAMPPGMGAPSQGVRTYSKKKNAGDKKTCTIQ